MGVSLCCFGVVEIGIEKTKLFEHIDHCSYCQEVMEDGTLSNDERFDRCSECYSEEKYKLGGG